MNQNYMKEREVLPLLLSMSLPMVLSMLVSSLYNIVDSFFISKISEDAMTALSLVFPVQNLVHAAAVGFGIGINAVISISLGAGKAKSANQSATLGMLLSGIHGLILGIGSIAVMPWFLGRFHASAQVVEFGLRYTNIVFLFSIAENMGIAGEKVFQSVGKMKVTMFSMMAGCIFNIILDPILIFGAGFVPAMGIEGAALATGIGQLVSFLIYLVIYLAVPINVKIRISDLKPDRSIIRRLYAIGVPATLNLALASLLVVVLNSILAGFSQIYVLVLGIYYKLQTFLYLPANGLVQGMRPLIGYNYGAGETERVGKIYRLVLTMSAGIMAVGTVICLLVPDRLIGIFSQNPETVREGAKAIRIICLGFLASSVSVAASGALEGIGKGKESLLISLCRYVLVMLPAAWILGRFFHAEGVWIAFPLTELITAAAAGGLWNIHRCSPGKKAV